MMMQLLWLFDELLMTSLLLYIVSVFIDRIFPAVLLEEIRVGVADAIAGLCFGDRVVVVRSAEEEHGEGGVGDVDFGRQSLSGGLSPEIHFDAEAVDEDDGDDDDDDHHHYDAEVVEKVSVGGIGVDAKEMIDEFKLVDEAAGEIRLESEEGELQEKSVEDHGGGGRRRRRAAVDDDDWEGIEQIPTGELFAAASDYFATPVGMEELSRLSPDVQLQVYALSKVAIDGPCYSTRPLSLKPSSRARWHAWRNLGDMSPEKAMEQYLTLLCGNSSEWGDSGFRVPASSSGTSSAAATTNEQSC